MLSKMLAFIIYFTIAAAQLFTVQNPDLSLPSQLIPGFLGGPLGLTDERHQLIQLGDITPVSDTNGQPRCCE